MCPLAVVNERRWSAGIRAGSVLLAHNSARRRQLNGERGRPARGIWRLAGFARTWRSARSNRTPQGIRRFARDANCQASRLRYPLRAVAEPVVSFDQCRTRRAVLVSLGAVCLTCRA
jgi:hypothetical protein